MAEDPIEAIGLKRQLEQASFVRDTVNVALYQPSVKLIVVYQDLCSWECHLDLLFVQNPGWAGPRRGFAGEIPVSIRLRDERTRWKSELSRPLHIRAALSRGMRSILRRHPEPTLWALRCGTRPRRPMPPTRLDAGRWPRRSGKRGDNDGMLQGCPWLEIV